MSHSQRLQNAQDIHTVAGIAMRPQLTPPTALGTIGAYSPLALGARLASEGAASLLGIFGRWNAANNQAVISRDWGTAFEMPRDADPIFFSGDANENDRTYGLYNNIVW